ncbi:DUF58 domain-containing protein [Bacillus sp. DX4.1]|uniref:DUF58 domain-containing protein n=1 Tax=Bacillus sp. DX4.1 TaxID=3055867 RepID=UPI0025A26D4E|nr:DUF58 domain-containing protein [Bacillus sp. DX4.1]MDM5189022.1 DUF58 domain-containing protein [Bacillus sp. DX4.1]
MNYTRIVTVPLFFQNHIIKLTIPVALFLAFYVPDSFLVFPFLFYYLFSYFIYRYTSYIEHYFQIINKKQTARLFPEEDGNLSIHLQNKAKLPLVNGTCFFHINPALVPHSDTGIEQISKTLFSFRFSQPAKSQQKWDLSFTATKRGVFQIEQFECIIGDPFHIIQVHLPAMHKLKTEIIVYPTLKRVVGLQEIHQLSMGTYRTNFSYFHDESSIVGVKQYERESFRSIHWKASAKMQSLQAKQYEAIKNYSWTISLYLGSDRGLGWRENIEDLISYTTYLCQFATEKKIPFELFVSIFAEEGPLHLALNEGHMQYAKALEELARISDDSTILPRESFFHYLSRKKERSSTMFFVGIKKANLPNMMQQTYLINDEGVVEQLENMGTLR